jgi:hypothetical protein
VKNCFIISFYLPTKDSVKILEDMLIKLSSNFKNPTFIIGFNPSPFITEAIQLIKSRNEFEILYGVVDDYLSCDSDASGFQKALKILKNSHKKYDLYWFLHSKAITSNRHHEREYMLNDFIENKEKIESLFNENNFIGSYGDMLIQLGTLKKGYKFTTPTTSGNYLDKFYNFKVKIPFEYFYAKTFFVIKGLIVNEFITKCNESFFNDYLNIYGEKNTDRYFFERDFIRLVDKMGYVVLGRVVSNGISDNRWGNISTEESNKRYLEEMGLWLEVNQLDLDKENIIKILKEWQRL